ncbi:MULTISPECIES: exodeoxyribonuclease VII large subunit [Thalassolituus]|jgi:exodeoxyribonuclease VII large subunit|uniref:exodeoxyribonuclease VII large subunit n=1 Tax=Thalassolituus TaxID=187492 RepID=UPI0011909536|nr:MULTISPECIES: exodeoxyribonuclease VII large subunit [Thalassolituus]MCB2386569.1 exodeoxyribonuclease VII large subunit [Thalassolituus alkanivorans]MCB2424253.1 exodeoxyribonuclease VII large subunit [Thalassolituus alkanivorans]TVV42350.1 exodeoxyribonuclease VII large subunit [Thalassolituus sp. C2-1]
MATSEHILQPISFTFVQATNIFTVSQLNQRAKQLLEVSFANVRVEGEISNLSRPSSGHWYFTLKDSGAQVRCAMFRSRTALLKFMPKEGDKVELRAKVSLYENRGDYQLIVDAMKPAGEGALLLAFQQLKDRLAMAGLFDDKYKQPMPSVRRVGIITSPTGAAIHDMLTVFRRRCPTIEIDIYPTPVQGRDATAHIVAAIERANRDNNVDVLIVGRGGGSLEDLWCFNEEAVAWAIHHSRLPIVSAVGHEVDFTIADFVADVRAPTPSAAAELLSPDQSQQIRQIQLIHQRLQRGMQRQLQQQQQRLLRIQQRLRAPGRLLQNRAQHLDQLEIRLQRAQQQDLQQRYHRLQKLQQALVHQHPQRLLRERQQQVALLEKQFTRLIQQRLTQRQQQLAAQAHLLNSLSPLNVLGRGYSITQQTDGRVVQQASEIAAGQRIHSRLHSGWLESEVIAVHTDSAVPQPEGAKKPRTRKSTPRAC